MAGQILKRELIALITCRPLSLRKIYHASFSPFSFTITRRFMKKTLTCAAILFILIGNTGNAQQNQQKMPVTTLNIGIHLIQAEVAIRDEDRARGLMMRQKMAPNEGMVFRFENTNQVCMWMKNTLLPLSVAFIDEAGTIINIEDMKPQTLDAHCAAKPARYALEMNQGWFKSKNIKPGTFIDGLPK